MVLMNFLEKLLFRAFFLSLFILLGKKLLFLEDGFVVRCKNMSKLNLYHIHIFDSGCRTI